MKDLGSIARPWLSRSTAPRARIAKPARVEYRHHSAKQKTISICAPGYIPTGKTQDTISFDLYRLFF